MDIKDFEKGDVFSFSAVCNIGDIQDIKLNADFDGYEDKDKALSDNIEVINEKLKFLADNLDKICHFAASDENIAMAEDWASGAEEAEDEETECYIMEDGSKVFFPITKEDFISAMRIEAIELIFDSDGTGFTVYFAFQPDYFSYHCLLIDINEDGSFDDGGLAG